MHDQLRITLGESNEIFDRGKGIYMKQTPDIERSIPSKWVHASSTIL